MESHNQARLRPSTGNTVYVFTYEDYLSTLIRSNDRLRDELEASQRKLLQSDCQLEAAKRTICELRSQLEEARRNSDKNLTRAKATADLSTVEFIKPCQAVEMDLPTLVQQLQKAHRNLEVCTAKLQSSAASTEDCDQEYSEKVQVLKNGIMNLGVKLQQEKVTLLKKAITLVPCNTEGEGNKNWSAQAEDLEKVNLQIQKINLELLQQALFLQSGHYQKKDPPKQHWIKFYKDQEQQTERLKPVAVRRVERSQEENKQKKEALLSEIHELKERLTAEEANNKTKTQDLEKKNKAAKQAELKAYLLQKELLRNKKEVQAQVVQVDHLKKVNKAISAQRRKAEEQLQVHFKQWQEEKTSLVTAIQELHELLNRKQPELSKQERHMVSRVKDLEERMSETLEKKSEKRQSWLVTLFPCLRFS